MMTVTSRQMNALDKHNNGASVIRCTECEKLLKIQEIKKEYTTPDDDVVKWPSLIGIPLPFKNITITKKEADLLDKFLYDKESWWKISKMSDVKELAFKKASETYSPKLDRPSYVPENRYNEWKLNDGHNDAFRHAYWNALMAKHLGQDFASQFATAHEGLPNNQQDRETMDLYNNSIGRQIAADNPNATDDELAQLIGDAVKDGKMLVFNEKSELSWSNDVAYGKHGLVKVDDAGSGSGFLRTPG